MKHAKGETTMATLDLSRPYMKPATPEERDHALHILALCGGNSVRASAELNNTVPASTLRTWKLEHTARYNEIRTELAPRIEAEIVHDIRSYVVQAAHAQHEALDATRALIASGDIKDPSAALRNISVSMAVNVDKALVLENRPTSIIEHRSTEEVMRGLTNKGYVDGEADEITDTDVLPAVLDAHRPEQRAPAPAADTP